MPNVLVLDLGTTNCKTAILDPEGRILARHSREYEVLFPQEGYAEQDPEQIWQMVHRVMKEVISSVNHPQEIRAMSFSVQGEAVIPVAGNGKPLYRTILGMDTRTGRENELLERQFGEEELYQTTGMPLHTVNTLPKILWLKANEPEIFARTWKFVLYEDYLTLKLAGEPVIDSSLASRTQMYDLKAGCWSEEILSELDIPAGKLSRIAAPGEIMCEMKRELADDLGLVSPVYLVAGGHDQACAALGSGTVEDNDAMDSVGTAEVVEVAGKKPRLDRDLMQAKISTYRHTVPEMYLTMTLNHSAGILVRWCVENFFAQECLEAEEKGLDRYSYILHQVSLEQPSFKLVLPHFNGSGTPYVRDHDLGLVAGLSLQDDRYALLKGVLEGLVYELKINIDLLEESGHKIEDLTVIGGGAKSEEWMQIRASILNRNLLSTTDKDVALFGAFILAASALDIFPGVKKGALTFKQQSKRELYEPKAELSAIYSELYDVYRELYPSITEINSRLEGLKKQA